MFSNHFISDNKLNTTQDAFRTMETTWVAKITGDGGDCSNGNSQVEDNGEDVHGGAGNGDTRDASGNGHQQDEGDALGNQVPNYGHQVVARMPVDKYASHYNMNHKNRGIALIFNHEIFEVANLKRRNGTEQDKKNLEAVLKGLGFNVRVFQDLKYHEIEAHIKQASDPRVTDHTHNDCIFVAVLTHGDTGILYARDTPYKPDALWGRFSADKCPSLAGKPKMFMLQACQGDKLDSGVLLHRTETDGRPMSSYRIPSQADFLVVYSTVGGFYSWRNTTRGSWFIQALCDELKSKAYELDLVTIMTFVSQRVALDFESNVPDSPVMHLQKQVPCIVSMLTRLIQFKQVGSEPEFDDKKEKSKGGISKFFQSGGKKA